MRTKITGISSLAGTEPEILLGVIYPPPTCNIRYKKTLAIGGLKIDVIFEIQEIVEQKESL